MLAMPILLFSLLPIRKEEPGLGPSIAFATTTNFTSLLAILFIDLRIGVFANWSLCEVWGQTIQSMAAKAMLSTHAVAPSIPQFNGLSKYRTNLGSPQSSAMPTVHIAVRTRGKGALGARCDYIGSPTNLIMITTTTLMLFAGRFGLAPSTNRKASAGLKLQDRESGLQTGDPAGFTATDTLACGSLGHIIGVGIVLGLKAVGSI